MNLPNKLTIFRMILVPIFVIFYYLDMGYLATAIFILASFTDFLDGYIARKNNLITNFGKFMDPLADKILVISALLLLLEEGRFGAWVLIVIISREFIISGIRLVASDNNVTIAASNMGKSKTFAQIIAIILMLSNNFGIEALGSLRLDEIFLYFSVLLTIISGIDYIVKNKDVLKNIK